MIEAVKIRSTALFSNVIFLLFALLASCFIYAQPVNDTCTNAEFITVTTANQTVNFNITDADINNEAGCGGTNPANYADVWYEFTMPITGNLRINGDIAWNLFAIYDACGGDQITCFSNSGLVDALVQGNTYKLRVFRTEATAQNSSFQSFIVRAIEATANETCADAENINVTASQATVNFSVNGAEINNDTGCEGTAMAEYLDIWYEFEMPVTGNLNINGGIAWNRFALYDSCGGNEIACFQNNNLIEGLQAGNTYRLRVFRTRADAFHLTFQSFTIQAFEVVPNDTCANAESITVSATPNTINFAITGAEILNEIGCEGSTAENYADVWYEFIMPFSGDLSIIGGITWNRFAIYDSCGGQELQCAEGNLFLQGLAQYDTYKIRVFRTASNASNSGFQNFTIQAFENPTFCGEITIWNGTSWSNGDPDDTKKAILNADFDLDSDLEVCELEVAEGTFTITVGNTLFANEDNSVIIRNGAAMHVKGVLNVQGNIVNNGSLVFVSNETATGQLGALMPGTTISGEVKVQQYISARRAFRFLSVPVTTTSTIRDNWQEGVSNTGTSFPGDNQNPNPGYGTHITGSQIGMNGFDATPGGNPSLFRLDNVQQSWLAATNTNSDILIAGEPLRIIIRGDRSVNVTDNNTTPTNTTLQATGTLHIGTFTDYGFSNVENVFNFFGNPYQTVVDMNAVLAASENLNASHYYVWDPTLNTRGAYVTVELPDGTNPSSSEASQYLQPGQAAFVQTLSNGSASITFEEVHKSVNQSFNAIGNMDVTTKLDLRLYENQAYIYGGKPADALRIKFSEEGTNAITFEDAPKFFNQDENLATFQENNLYSIQSRAIPQNQEEIPLFINQYRHTHYILEAEVVNLNGFIPYLKDLFNGQQIVLQNDNVTTYAFQITGHPSSLLEDRFLIEFRENTLNMLTIHSSDVAVYPIPVKEDAFYIKSNDLTDVKPLLFNALGADIQFLIEYPKEGLLKITVPNLARGVYLLKITLTDGSTYHKRIIKK